MSDNPLPNSGSSSASVSSHVRGRADPTWAHVSEEIDPRTQKKNALICLYCKKRFGGAGINRVKQHLAKKKGDVAPCLKVPYDVQWLMKQNLGEIIGKKKEFASQEAERIDEDAGTVSGSLPNTQSSRTPISDDLEILHSSGSKRAKVIVQDKGENNIDSFIAPRNTTGGQPSIKSALASKEVILDADCRFVRWMYDVCMPFNAVNSVYFRPFLDGVAKVGPGYKGPSYQDCRGQLLKAMVKEVQLFIDGFRSEWARCGCTVMADGWTDISQRTLINFLVYCPKGMIFVKSVDATDIVKNQENLYLLLKDIVQWVGVENIVHIVTDNASNYVAACRLLIEEFPSLYRSPCAAHCLNLMFSDIGQLPNASELVKKASKVTVFIYNHTYVLALCRKRPGWTEIICPAATRFATNFIALQSLLSHKHDLQGVITSLAFVDSSYGKTAKGKVVSQIVLDNEHFWHECTTIVRVTEPLIRVLRIVDSDERPAMGYMYDAMEKAREAIKHACGKRKTEYLPYLQIVDRRWDRQMRQTLHAAGYYLNPFYQYKQGSFKNHPTIKSGLLDVMEKYANGSDSLLSKLNRDLTTFEDCKADFGRKMTLNAIDSMVPGMRRRKGIMTLLIWINGIRHLFG